MSCEVQRTESYILALLMIYGNASRNITKESLVIQSLVALSSLYTTKHATIVTTHGRENYILNQAWVSAI